MEECMFPECQRRTTACGLCNKHYVAALTRVKQGIVTWDELVEHKKCLPTDKKAPTHTWFTDFKNVK